MKSEIEFVRRILASVELESLSEAVRAFTKHENDNLLGVTLSATVARVRDMPDWLNAMTVTDGSLTLKIGDERCAAERLMQRRHIERIEAGDYKNSPPYFPGDSCRLS